MLQIKKKEWQKIVQIRCAQNTLPFESNFDSGSALMRLNFGIREFCVVVRNDAEKFGLKFTICISSLDEEYFAFLKLDKTQKLKS